MRIFRSRSLDTRLAVMLATAPLANFNRAFAMSTDDVNNGTPTAATSTTRSGMSVRIKSMSWIMRSSTTATSAPRGVNGASRSLSMNRGRSTSGRAAPDGAVEPLDVTGLQQYASRTRGRDQLVGFGDRGGERLLDEHVAAAGQSRAAHLGVGRRRHHHGERVHGVEQRIEAREGRHAQLVGDRTRATGAAVVEADELRAVEIAQQSDVVIAQRTRSHHSNPRRATERRERRPIAQISTPRSLSRTKSSRMRTSGIGDGSAAARSSACDRLSSEQNSTR